MTWLRWIAIAIGALSLASCRSMSAPHAPSRHANDRAPRACAESSQACGCCERPPCPAPPPCHPMAIVPPPPVSVARVCKVCDGGDGGRPAKATGRTGLENLTAGDTVARFRPADAGEDEVCVVESNCACAFAPRFASVREITRPHEDHSPTGAVAVSLDNGPELASFRTKSRAGTQRTPPVLARTAVPELAVVDATPPFGLEREMLPGETPYVCTPAEDVLDQKPELARSGRRPQVAIAFDVPLAWTCLAQAQVMIQEQAAETVSVADGTAVLRLKKPGRAELTLCKTAGGKTVRTGEELDFTIALYNSGDCPLDGIVLTDALPKRLVLVPDSADSTLRADVVTETGDDGSVVLKWVFQDPLPAGGSGFVRFRTIVR